MTNLDSTIESHLFKQIRNSLGVLSLSAQSGDEIQWFDLSYARDVFHALKAWNEKVDGNGNPTNIEMVVAQFDDLPPFENLTVELVAH
jgi:hypothetical protein